MKSLLLFLAAAATATSAAAAVDLAAGAAKAQACFACHGPLGISAMPQVPSLAGQPDGFLQWQLVFFRGGRRASPVMQPIAEALKDDDIRNLAAFFAAQPPPAKAQGGRDDALRASGLQLVRGNRCISCHQDDLSGTQATARLAGQREDYLLKALRDFKSGARTGGAMAAMQEVVAPFSDEQLRAIAHAIAHWSS